MSGDTIGSRSATMRAVHSVNTAPEMIVRRLLHALGYRYRLHVKGLPGTPDIVFASRKKALFINGCFWHGHSCSRGARVPKTNTDYWISKITRNRAHDIATKQALKAEGWKLLVVWECELRTRPKAAYRKLKAFLGPA